MKAPTIEAVEDPWPSTYYLGISSSLLLLSAFWRYYYTMQQGTGEEKCVGRGNSVG